MGFEISAPNLIAFVPHHTFDNGSTCDWWDSHGIGPIINTQNGLSLVNGSREILMWPLVVEALLLIAILNKPSNQNKNFQFYPQTSKTSFKMPKNRIELKIIAFLYFCT